MNAKLRFPQGIAAAMVFALALVGCDTGPKSSQGFRLPDGDPEKGKTAFIALK